MKKFFALLILVVALTAPTLAQADFVSTFFTFGEFGYWGDGSGDPDDFFGDILDIQENTQQDAVVGDEGEYYGLLYAVYDLDIGHPDEPIVLPQWLDYEFFVSGEFEIDGDEGDFFEEDDGSIDLGEFAVTDDDISDLFIDIADFLDDIGHVEILGDDESGVLLFGLEDNVLGFDEDDYIEGEFALGLRLTSHQDSNVIPEPASLLLFTSGIFGFAGLRRRFS